jgi:OOP family OmpA-OmpF porin
MNQIKHTTFLEEKVMLRHIIIVGVILHLALACTKNTGITNPDVLAQHDLVQKLSQELTAAEDEGASFLVPEGFADAKEILDEAAEYAVAGKKSKSEVAAREGLAVMITVRGHMKESREVMSEVLAVRERARNAGAPGLYSKKYTALEERLLKGTRFVELDKIKKAVKLRPELLEAYSALELKALKRGTVEAAKAAIKRAVDYDAETYAPKTLRQAKRELKTVFNVLDSDRTQTAKADHHAQRVIWLAGRAESITKLAKTFEERDFSLEDMLLWYQKQLIAINVPLKGDLPFNQPNAVVVEGLQSTLASLMEGLKDARTMSRKNQARIVEMEKNMKAQGLEYQGKITEILGASRKELVVLRKKYAGELSEKAKKNAEAERIALEMKGRVEYVKGMFEKGEAVVSSENNDLTIQIHRFRFKPGGAEINAVNFGLLNKVISAIGQFPGAKVTVSGHTDSVGNADKNLALSVKRAANVEKFLVEVGDISRDIINSKGFGETKPIAPNGNKAGRALNRRIEVRISNN